MADGDEPQENPPNECEQPENNCGCDEGGDSAANGCVMLAMGLGRTTPWSGSRDVKLKVFEEKASPALFTPETLYVVMDYTFKGIGSDVLADGTPRTVRFSAPNGEKLTFSFAPGESAAAPNPGLHTRRAERLMMVDAEGWAVTNNPAYYDLNVGDGGVWRYLASDATGERGRLVFFRDARGRVVTPDDFGLDVVRDANGVRQVLTPSRLADVTCAANGYDVRVYAVRSAPPLGPDGLYAVPSAEPERTLSVRRGADDRELFASFATRGGSPRVHRYVFEGGERDVGARLRRRGCARLCRQARHTAQRRH